MLLARETVRDIHLRSKDVNVVVRFDKAKAYDRVSWIFLTIVLRKFGFPMLLINMVWRLISANWYLMLIDGQTHQLFPLN